MVGIFLAFSTGVRLYFLFASIFSAYLIFNSLRLKNILTKRKIFFMISLVPMVFIGIIYSLGYRFDGSATQRLIGYFNRSFFNSNILSAYSSNSLFLDLGSGLFSHIWLYIPRFIVSDKPLDIGTAYALQYLFPNLSKSSTPSLGIFISQLVDFGSFFPLFYLFNLENLIRILFIAYLFFKPFKSDLFNILYISFIVIGFTMPFIFQFLTVFILIYINNLFKIKKH
jgi:hypothetical protein